MPTPPSPAVPPSLSVIVADDEDEIRNILVDLLRHAGHRVSAAGTGLEAMQQVSRETGLIVADILMPNGDGLDLIRHAKHLNPTVRILAISGGGPYQSGEFTIEVALQNGADAALLKPFSGEEFVAAVQRVLTEATLKPQVLK